MNEQIRKAVQEFLYESDRREVDRLKFFSDRGLRAKLACPEEGLRSPIIVYVEHEDEGTVLPPIRLPLGLSGVNAKIVNIYYEVSNHNLLDPIKAWEVVKLPTVVECPHGQFNVQDKGVIDGNAP